MTVLVTGGAGFIGSAVIQQLLEMGEEQPLVFDLAREAPRLDAVRDRIRYVEGDLGDPGQVMVVVQENPPDVIFHLGAMLSRASESDPASSLRSNVLGTFHVLEAARQHGVRQVLFASSIGTYGLGLAQEAIDDDTLQRPELFYGATKLFGELMGLFYRRKYGLDFRGLRFVSIVGPGLRTDGIDHYTSWVIEECAAGRPFTIWVRPETRMPLLYVKDAARALVLLGQAPRRHIRTVNYLVTGPRPAPTARQLAEAVRSRIPEAQITFDPDPESQAILDRMLRPVDDSMARSEWGWQPEYGLERMVKHFLAAIGIGRVGIPR